MSTRPPPFLGPRRSGSDLIIADAHRLLVDALALALAGRGYRIRATATTRNGLVGSVLQHRPDSCVLDLQLLDGGALEAVELIHRCAPEVRILALSRNPDPALVAVAVQAGAAGYLGKDHDIDMMDRALRRLAAGELFIEPALSTVSLRQARSRGSGPDEPFRWLTQRELEVLRRLTQGDGTTEIARALSMTTNTARTHVQNVLDKLGVHTRLEAVALAHRLGAELRAG